mgnify:CR=1 FL=1
MKKLFLAALAMSLFVGCEYDDSEIWGEIGKLREEVNQNSEDIATLSALVDALDKGKLILSTEQTAEGVILRSGPAKSYERVLYLSKGADLTVYAKENGYCYVRSNRYGVYGWVSASYASEGRPETDTTKVTKNTVSPDKKYSKAETKITLNGLNLRKGPGTEYDVITLIPKNYPVKVIGYKQGISGWVYVTDTTYGYSGWVSSAYIK